MWKLFCSRLRCLRNRSFSSWPRMQANPRASQSWRAPRKPYNTSAQSSRSQLRMSRERQWYERCHLHDLCSGVNELRYVWVRNRAPQRLHTRSICIISCMLAYLVQFTSPSLGHQLTASCALSDIAPAQVAVQQTLRPTIF
jgi:hypothetical protein